MGKQAPKSMFHETLVGSDLITHWGRVTHICVCNLTIIGWNNGFSPGRHQAIIWTSDGMLLIWPPGTKFSEMIIEIHIVSFEKMHSKISLVCEMAAISCRSQCVKVSCIQSRASVVLWFAQICYEFLVELLGLFTRVFQDWITGIGVIEIAPVPEKYPWRVWEKSTITKPQKNTTNRQTRIYI